MDQANGSRESSLPPLLCRRHDGKQRSRCRERPRGKGRRRLLESSAPVLPGVCFFNLLLKVSRPGISHQQPHQQRGGHGKKTLIEEVHGGVNTKKERKTSNNNNLINKHK